MSTPPFSICALHTSPHLQVPFTAWSPDIRHHTKRKYKPRPRLPEEHGEPPGGTGGDRPAGTGGGRPPSEAGSVRSEGLRRSGRSGGTGSEASTARGHVAREVVVPMPSRDDLGEAHTDPPLDRVTLAARQPDPAWTQQVPPGPDGRQRHLIAVWDMVLESRGVQRTFRISFPCPIVVRGGGGGDVCLQACEWALAGADRGVADWGGGDGDHGWGLWAECAHGLGPAEAGVGGRGMACHARPCGEAAEDGGG